MSQRPFISGETVDLLVPTLEHVETSTWADWFNSQQTNAFTNHAVFPNTVENQRDFFFNLQGGSRFALLVAPKGSTVPVGTVSLSGIDFRLGIAAISIVMDTETDEKVSTFAALESLARLTQHAFEVMGLRRVEAGQAYPALARWNQYLEIFGYRTEGFRRQSFARGYSISDGVTLACIYPTFQAIMKKRQGQLWPGSKEVMALIRALPAKSFAQLLDESYSAIAAEYFGEES